MVEVLDHELVKPLKRILVIDDAYAPAAPADITGEGVTRFKQELQDEAKRLRQVKTEFKRPELDPSVSGQLNGLLEDAVIVSRLWQLSERPAWSWLTDTLFREYAAEVATKRLDLAGLDEFLVAQKLKASKTPTFDPENLDIATCQIIFLDFYLKGEDIADSSLERATRLAHLIIQAKTDGSLKQYPLVVLMSSRNGAQQRQDEFKERTGLRADFFCFVEKGQIASSMASKLKRMVEGYAGKQDLAHMLDEFWLGAIRAAQQLRQSLARIEPSELALLHEAELAVEEAPIFDYLAWLASETLASGLLEDRRVRALGAQNVLPKLISHSAFPGAVPPSSLLADMYLRSVMRLDINDDNPDSRAAPVELGDVFAKVDSNGNPLELVLVIDQSCDLARPSSGVKTSVLCLRCEPQQLTDIAMAFYRTINSSRGASDLIAMTVAGERRYYLAIWDLVNPTTPKLNSLSRRPGGYKRLARLKPVAALARQELLTSHVGRIGEPVAPPSVEAYRAKLILVGKDNDFQKEFDATKEEWAAAVIVQGRHLAKPDPAGNVSKKKPGTTSSLSLTSDFSDWLLKKLDKLSLSDMQATSQGQILRQNIAAGAVQRLQFENVSSAAGAVQDWRKALLKKPTLSMHCVFDKSMPKDLKDAKVVLLLTPYRQR